MSLALDIETSIEFVIERANKTRAAQATLSAAPEAWVWPEKTLAQWDADLLQTDGGTLGTLAYNANRDHVAFENAHGLLDERYGTMKARTKQAVLIMRGKAARNAALAPAVDELTAKASSWRGIEDEAEDCLAVWTTTFGGAAYTPAPGNTHAGFKVLFDGDAAAVPPVASLRALKTPHREKLAVARVSTGLFNALVSRLENECVQWYADATAIFLEGTPLGDMIRNTVPTSNNYNPPTGGGGGGGTVPAPTGVAFTQENPGDAVVAAADAVSGGLFKVYQRGAGSGGDFALVSSGSTPPLVFTISPGDYEFNMTVTLGGVESAPTSAVTLTVA